MDEVANSKFINKKYNHWTVLDIIRQNRRTYFKCICDCDNEIVKNVLKDNVISNKSKSCGCVNSKNLIARNSSFNLYEEYDNFIKGYDSNENEFFVSKEDFPTVQKYYWGKDKIGYFTATINNMRVLLHRYILSAKEQFDVDHINHKPNDNRRSNLRLCSHAENLCNAKLNIKNKSGCKGVFFDDRYNKWEAYGMKNYKKYYLGRYFIKEDAIIARKKWEEDYQKEYKYSGENLI